MNWLFNVCCIVETDNLVGVTVPPSVVGLIAMFGNVRFRAVADVAGRSMPSSVACPDSEGTLLVMRVVGRTGDCVPLMIPVELGLRVGSAEDGVLEIGRFVAGARLTVLFDKDVCVLFSVVGTV